MDVAPEWYEVEFTTKSCAEGAQSCRTSDRPCMDQMQGDGYVFYQRHGITLDYCQAAQVRRVFTPAGYVAVSCFVLAVALLGFWLMRRKSRPQNVP
jgi:hypothetical protein